MFSLLCVMHFTIKKLKRIMSHFLGCSRTESTLVIKCTVCDVKANSLFLKDALVSQRLQSSSVGSPKY